MNRKTPYSYWRRVAPHTSFEFADDYARPLLVAKRKTPETLNDITMGQLIRLTNQLTENEDFPLTVCETLLGMTAHQTLKAPAVEVVAFAGWAAGELKRIGDIWKAANIEPTKEESAAGVSNLSFGFFGTLDWYAQRMGIQRHADVENVKWVVVYQCSKMDGERTLYERRLQKQYADENNRQTNRAARRR